MDTPRPSDDWVSVFTASTDYEADLVRDRLGDAGIEAVVNTQRDHAFNLTVGSLAEVHVMVPRERAEEARALVEAPPVSDADLEAQALSATHTDDAYTPDNEARLDSGADGLSFDVPADAPRAADGSDDGPDALHVPPVASAGPGGTVRTYDAPDDPARRA